MRRINSIDYAGPYWEVSLAGIGALNLRREEFERYLADPDEFACDYLGCEIEEYHEWVECGGIALCGARTKSGRLCKRVVDCCNHAGDWLSKHRRVACRVHGGGRISEPPPPDVPSPPDVPPPPEHGSEVERQAGDGQVVWLPSAKSRFFRQAETRFPEHSIFSRS